MKAFFLALGGVAVCVLIASSVALGSYNAMTGMDVASDNALAQIQVQYQRRADLVDQLVATIQRQADFESSTLEQIVASRASVGSVKLDADTIVNPGKMKAFEAAQAQLSGALSRLMVVMENYPTLKSNDSFRDLLVAIEGSENRISEARRQYNLTCQKYNTAIRVFPSNIVAGVFGLNSPKVFFEADPNASQAPKINDMFSGGYGGVK